MSNPVGKRTFICPYCNQKLSFLDGTLIKMMGRLHAETFSCKTMIYIPAQLGHYGAIVGEGVRMKEGAKIEFECINGSCKRNFTTEYDKHLAEIKMVDSEEKEFVVVFNKTFGKNSTFLVDYKARKLVTAYGEDADDFTLDFDKPINFFGK